VHRTRWALPFILTLTASAQDWPSFRGPAASGIADEQNLPANWDASQGTGIRWKASIPGLAHSSPIVWRDQVFVTTAISSRPNASLPDYEWGTASSPILYRETVIVQCDQQKGSFLEALDRKSGRTVWRTERDELPSWGTPAICPGKTRTELITNGANFVRGYDPATGNELWRLGGSSKITAPTPVYSGDLIVVASGRRPEAPIFAIRAGGSGNITGKAKWVAWQKEQRGPYMPTPLIYNGYLYILGNAGIFDCYDLTSGREIYRERLPHQGSGFSASPVASDGKIYLPSEDGDIFVVKAGPRFELLKRNSMGEPIMATPAISGGLLLSRTEHTLWAIGNTL